MQVTNNITSPQVGFGEDIMCADLTLTLGCKEAVYDRPLAQGKEMKAVLQKTLQNKA